MTPHGVSLTCNRLSLLLLAVIFALSAACGASEQCRQEGDRRACAAAVCHLERARFRRLVRRSSQKPDCSKHFRAPKTARTKACASSGYRTAEAHTQCRTCPTSSSTEARRRHRNVRRRRSQRRSGHADGLRHALPPREDRRRVEDRQHRTSRRPRSRRSQGRPHHRHRVLVRSRDDGDGGRGVRHPAGEHRQANAPDPPRAHRARSGHPRTGSAARSPRWRTWISAAPAFSPPARPSTCPSARR